MNRVLRSAVILSIFVAMPLAAHRSESPEETIVFVVRHAEKASDGKDPDLSEAGRARAATLAHVLGDAGVDAIFTTQYLRTRQTAQPLATAKGLEIQVIDANATHVTDTAEKIRSKHRGDTVVVVGHSNTVGPILAALGAENPPELTDEDYDGLYMITIRGDGSTDLLTLRYGK